MWLGCGSRGRCTYSFKSLWFKDRLAHSDGLVGLEAELKVFRSLENEDNRGAEVELAKVVSLLNLNPFSLVVLK